MVALTQIPRSMAVSTTKKKTWWSRLIMGLNNLMNPGHAWRDYENDPDSSSTFDNIINAADDVINGIAQNSQSIVDRMTQAHQTGAEVEAQEFSANEAQKSRDFTEYMSRNKYQMETQSMEQSGINPAMMYGGGQLVPTASNGAQGQASAPGSSALNPFDVIMTMARMPKELALLDAEKANVESQTKRNDAETGKFEVEKSILGLELEWFPALKRATINELNSRVDLNKVYEDKGKAETDLTRAREALQKFENKYADEYYSLRNAFTEAEKNREISRKDLNDIQSAMYRIEKEYMEENDMKMGSSEWYSVVVALLAATGSSPNSVIDSIIKSGGHYADVIRGFLNPNGRPILYHEP